MKNDAALRALVTKALRDPKAPRKQSDFAAHMGYGKAWVTKFFKGQPANLTEEQVRKIEKFIGYDLFAVTAKKERVPRIAVDIAKALKSSDDLAKVITDIVELHQKLKDEIAEFSVPFVESRDMSRLGNQIIALAHADPDKGGKVMRETLNLLQGYADKRRSKLAKKE